MTGENGQPSSFKFDMSEAVALEIKSLIKQANLQGLGPQVVRALRIIIGRIRNDPLQFGELFGRHQSLNLLVHVAVVHPLVVYFAIHPEKRFVLIQRIFQLPE
jgi:hypothetical protein